MRGETAGDSEDEKAHERAVLAPKRQGDEDALMLELEAGGREQSLAGFRFADEPARQHGEMRTVSTPLAGDRAAETVFLPVHQRAPGRSAGTLEHGRYLVERG